MRSLDWIEGGWDEATQSPKDWLPVDTSHLSPKKRAVFRRRKWVLKEYILGKRTVKEIARAAGTSPREVYRLIERAKLLRPDGLRVGWYACLPDVKLKEYTRVDTSTRGKAGRWMQFLRSYPAVYRQVHRWALGEDKVLGTVLRGNATGLLFAAFETLCAEEGIDIGSDYPFTNGDRGQEALRRYVNSVRERHFAAAARIRFGDASGSLATINGRNSKENLATRTYGRTELDGHRLDCEHVLRLRNALGEEELLPLARVWLLVLLDELSRAILGYCLSLGEMYSMEDVLACIESAYTPWTAKDPPPNSITYLPGAGLPSGVVEGCAWRCFDTLKLDNAYAHRSSWLQERVINAGGLEVVLNRPHAPRGNTFAESTIGTIAEFFHTLPNTVGSGPKDPRRRNPTAAAKRLEIDLEDLELITDVTIANYNATPHGSLSGRSPLEYLRLRLERGHDFPRYASRRTPEGLALFERDFPVTIRANPKLGHRPYVQKLYTRYTGAALTEGLKYRNKRATLRLNIRDVRSGWLFVDGLCLGRVDSELRWMQNPHSAQVRRAIAALTKERKIAANSHQPVADYLKYLEARAPLKRKERNRLARTRAEVGEVQPTPVAEVPDQRLQPGQPGWISLKGPFVR